MTQKPVLSFLKIWNMCFGFLGIQIGFSLQNANVSRIFQTLGAETENLSVYWVAAPLTGRARRMIARSRAESSRGLKGLGK